MKYQGQIISTGADPDGRGPRSRGPLPDRLRARFHRERVVSREGFAGSPRDPVRSVAAPSRSLRVKASSAPKWGNWRPWDDLASQTEDYPDLPDRKAPLMGACAVAECKNDQATGKNRKWPGRMEAREIRLRASVPGLRESFAAGVVQPDNLTQPITCHLVAPWKRGRRTLPDLQDFATRPGGSTPDRILLPGRFKSFAAEGSAEIHSAQIMGPGARITYVERRELQ